MNSNSALFEKLLSKALNYISYRQRSRKEIEMRLNKYIAKESLGKKEADLIKSQVISRLAELGFINDEDFTKLYISQMLDSKKPVGKKMIIYKLKSKGISEELIGKYISDYSSESEYENAFNLARRYVSKNSLNAKTKSKLIRYLYNRGFESNVVYAVVDTLTSVP